MRLEEAGDISKALGVPLPELQSAIDRLQLINPTEKEQRKYRARAAALEVEQRTREAEATRKNPGRKRRLREVWEGSEGT